MGLFDRLFGKSKKEESLAQEEEIPVREEATSSKIEQWDTVQDVVEEDLDQSVPDLPEAVDLVPVDVLGDQDFETVQDVIEKSFEDNLREADSVPRQDLDWNRVQDLAEDHFESEVIQSENLSDTEAELLGSEAKPEEVWTDSLLEHIAGQSLTKNSLEELVSLESKKTVADTRGLDQLAEGQDNLNSQGTSHENRSADLHRSSSLAQIEEMFLDKEKQTAVLQEKENTQSSLVEETTQEKYDRSLKKTRTGFGAKLNAFFANFRTVDEEFFEDLEELLITSDVGVQVATTLTEELRQEAKLENTKKGDELRRLIIEKLVAIYEGDGNFDHEKINFQENLTVMLFVGVNGVGKTTSIGKLANQYKQAGKKVMLVAADTFRAGAVAQLVEWGHRIGVEVVRGPEKSDPASVVYDGMERALAEKADVLMIDTAGRLQNKDHLMAELEKIGRIIKRVLPDAPHETLLALDASTGQNALVQAKEFSKITPLTGLVLTKIDGTARGGVVLAIRQELDIPVKLIGFGEKVDDIGQFNSEDFIRGLLEGLI